VFELIIEVLEELNPLCLVASDFLWFAKVLQVLVICSYFDGELSSKEVGSAAFKSEDDANEFFVMGIVILFCWLEAA
jgi:hypothetical protein